MSFCLDMGEMMITLSAMSAQTGWIPTCVGMTIHTTPSDERERPVFLFSHLDHASRPCLQNIVHAAIT